MVATLVTIYIPDIHGRFFLTVSYRATALTKALVKVINDDEIAWSGKEVDEEAAIQPRTPLRELY